MWWPSKCSVIRFHGANWFHKCDKMLKIDPGNKTFEQSQSKLTIFWGTRKKLWLLRKCRLPTWADACVAAQGLVGHHWWLAGASQISGAKLVRSQHVRVLGCPWFQLLRLSLCLPHPVKRGVRGQHYWSHHCFWPTKVVKDGFSSGRLFLAINKWHLKLPIGLFVSALHAISLNH